MTSTLRTEVLSATVLRFDDGTPVRAASAVAAYEGGWLVAQDDATHGAWWVDDSALLNLEGACVVGPCLRWFHRGAADVPSASVDVPLDALFRCVDAPREVPVGGVRTYDLGTVDGVSLAVTDALALHDGTVLVSAAAEDTPNPYDDGPVVAAALALLDNTGVRALARLPEFSGIVPKVEGLAPRRLDPDGLELLAVVDADDPEQPFTALVLDVRW